MSGPSKRKSPFFVRRWNEWASPHITPERVVVASWLIVALICAMYILRTSGVVLFRGGDNAHYILLGKALAEGRGYADIFKAHVAPHTQYPPLFPALLSMVILAKGMDSYLMNLVVSLCTAATIIVFFTLLRKEKFALPLLPVVWFGGWMDAFYYTDSILTESAYMAFSLATLLFMGMWTRKRNLLCPAIAVLFCWLAVMTRTAGVTLMAAVAAGAFFCGGVSKKSSLRAAGMLIICSLPLIAWSIRNSMLGETSTNYINQFLLVNPGKPGEGYLSAFSLLERIWNNSKIHFMDLGRVTGMKSTGLVSGGLLLLGITGFVQRARRGISTPELYTMFYIGLILIWPYANVRFMLPVYPLVLAYIVGGAFVSVKKIPAARLKTAASAVAVTAFLAVMAANITKVNKYYQNSRKHYNTHKVRVGEKLYLCATSEAYNYMLKASLWLRERGEPEAVAMARKPTLVALASGHPVVGVPKQIPEDPAGWLAENQVKYVILDQLYPNVSNFLSAMRQDPVYLSRVKILYRISGTAVLSMPPSR